MPKIGPQGLATDASLPDGEREFWATEAQPVDEPREVVDEEVQEEQSDEKPPAKVETKRTTRK